MALVLQFRPKPLVVDKQKRRELWSLGGWLKQAQATPARLPTPSLEKYNGTASALVDLLAAGRTDARGRPVPSKLASEPSSSAERGQTRQDGPAALEVVGRVERGAHTRRDDATYESQPNGAGTHGETDRPVSSEDARGSWRDGGRVPAFSAEVRDQVVDRAEEDVTPLHEELEECEEVRDVLDIVRDEAEALGPARTVMAFARFATLHLFGYFLRDWLQGL